MRAAVVGAGVAGLATAAALSRSGHTVTVFEQAPSLRASGLAFHLWSNATSLFPELGVRPDRIPGEPLDRMLMRAGGRQVGVMNLAPAGLPHVTVERADVLSALAAVLPPGTISYGVRCADVDELAGDHDLVVIADGAHSALRRALVPPPRRRWRWMVWQACVPAELPDVPEGCGVGVIRPGMFVGVFRLGGGRFTWFVELPGRTDLDGHRLLHALGRDDDPLLRVLADALAAEPDLDQALRGYETVRLPRVRRAVAMGRAGALARPSNPAIRAIPPVSYARFLAVSGGPALRRLTRPTVRPPNPN